MPTPNINNNKLSPQLRLLFTRAANGEFPMDQKMTLIMRARQGFESEHFEIRSEIGNVFTGEATLEQVEELVKDRHVQYIETPTRMSLS